MQLGILRTTGGRVLRDHPHRQPIRLRGYDYCRPGRYFVTIVTAAREEAFGTIVDGEMHLSDEGVCVADVWTSLPRHYRHISLDAFVVMPNHVHGVMILRPGPVGDVKPAPLSEVIRGFKTPSARRVNAIRDVSGAPVWQRNYYERIIRNDRELQHVRRYIADNPLRWAEDTENPRRPR